MAIGHYSTLRRCPRGHGIVRGLPKVILRLLIRAGRRLIYGLPWYTRERLRAIRIVTHRRSRTGSRTGPALIKSWDWVSRGVSRLRRSSRIESGRSLGRSLWRGARIRPLIRTRRRRPPILPLTLRGVASRGIPLTLIVTIGHTRIHSSSSRRYAFVVASCPLGPRRGSALHVGLVARHGRHGLCPSVLRLHRRRRSRGPSSAWRRVRTENVGEGGISLVAGRRTVSALVVLVIGHSRGLFAIA